MNGIFDFSNLKRTSDPELAKKSSSNLSKGSSVAKKEEEDQALSILFQGGNKGKELNLNAKKLEVDFDSMDFFDSFEPKKKPPKKEEPSKEETKLKSVNKPIPEEKDKPRQSEELDV